MDSDLTYYRRRASQEAAAAAAADGAARQIHLELARRYGERCITIESAIQVEVSHLPPAPESFSKAADRTREPPLVDG